MADLVVREVGGAERAVAAAQDVVQLLQLALQQARPLVHLAHHPLDLLLATEVALAMLASWLAPLLFLGRCVSFLLCFALFCVVWFG